MAFCSGRFGGPAPRIKFHSFQQLRISDVTPTWVIGIGCHVIPTVWVPWIECHGSVIGLDSVVVAMLEMVEEAKRPVYVGEARETALLVR